MHVYKNYSDLSFNYMFLKSNLLFFDLHVATKLTSLSTVFLKSNLFSDLQVATKP